MMILVDFEMYIVPEPNLIGFRNLSQPTIRVQPYSAHGGNRSGLKNKNDQVRSGTGVAKDRNPFYENYLSNYNIEQYNLYKFY